ncbi:tyrosine-type recombinase/integrase [Nocardia tengchongensis]|uniref:tyrosine-type recombinase/integrase n=1 Tax=Nocardia tengchongensis TaxID=2055889 RepID=UPI0036B4CDFE
MEQLAWAVSTTASTRLGRRAVDGLGIVHVLDLLGPQMASLTERVRSDGSIAHIVLYRRNGKQSSTTFDDFQAALQLKKRIDKLGLEQALQLLDAELAAQGDAPGLTCAVDSYIGDLSGIEDGTKTRYRRFLANDLAPFFGAHTPVDAIDDKAVARWVNHLEQVVGNASKTIANKHGFLYAFMASLTKSGVIAGNPCENTKLPRVDQAEMVFLEGEEFAALIDQIPGPWKAFVRFLVASGARMGEVTALRVGDIDPKRGTCRIRRAWKYTGGVRTLGRPKTKRSNRTLDLDPALIAELPLAGRPRGDWLFINTHGDPVHITTFYKQIWAPALTRLAVDPAEPLNGKRPRIHDLRHTCASWMLGANIPMYVVQRHLGHESITTTSDRYGHLDRRAGSAAAAVIGAMISRTAQPALKVVEGAA